jgi:hypothetical protein
MNAETKCKMRTEMKDLWDTLWSAFFEATRSNDMTTLLVNYSMNECLRGKPVDC